MLRHSTYWVMLIWAIQDEFKQIGGILALFVGARLPVEATECLKAAGSSHELQIRARTAHRPPMRTIRSAPAPRGRGPKGPASSSDASRGLPHLSVLPIGHAAVLTESALAP